MSENYSFYEQETNINYNRQEDMAVVYTASPVDIRKLDKLFEKRGSEMKLQEKTEGSRTYLVPKKWVKIIPSMIISDERRKEMSERGKLAMQNLHKKHGASSMKKEINS